MTVEMVYCTPESRAVRGKMRTSINPRTSRDRKNPTYMARMVPPTFRVVSRTGPRLGPQVVQLKAQATWRGVIPQALRDHRPTATPRTMPKVQRLKTYIFWL